MSNREVMRCGAAEFIGTFALVFAGTGAIVVNDLSGGAIGHPGIAAAFGLVVMTMIYAVGDISGAHFNPAVTFGFYLAGRFSGNKVLPYLAAQISAALAASVLLHLLFPAHGTLGATLPQFGEQSSFLLEIVLTFFLMFVILGVSTGAKEKGLMAGIAVGGVVLLCALFGGPISGASMNPARSLGPAIVSGRLDAIWIYLAAPILGSIAAVCWCKLIRSSECCSMFARGSSSCC